MNLRTIECFVTGVGQSGALLHPASIYRMKPTSSRGITKKGSIATDESEVLPNVDETKTSEIVNQNLSGGHWYIAPTQNKPNSSTLPELLLNAVQAKTHPVELQSELGNGVFITEDWRKAWYTYQSPPEDPDLICSDTGEAAYEITDIDGVVPDDLVGILYRNGPGKFGVNSERVAHVLDADGLVLRIHFIPKSNGDEKRKVMFRSQFIQTKEFVEESEANKFLYRGTFGTCPRGLEDWFPSERLGLNEEPPIIPNLSKIAGNAFRTSIKNTANTQIISFGGKLLALFEAGLPYRLDPVTLDTIGEDDLDGALKKGVPVKIPSIPDEFSPSFINGSAHTAHPNVCPRTGHLVGWDWTQLPATKSLEVTFTEWSPDGFKKVASSTFEIPGCELAPHDMAITENYIVLLVNALSMNSFNFISGLKGPAASLNMDGKANVTAWVFPRPTSSISKTTKPFAVEVPPNFSIHFSHAYEDSDQNSIIAMFSGWPPNNSKDFLGAWGGFAPIFDKIPPTFLWKLEIPIENSIENRDTRSTVKSIRNKKLSIAPGSANACIEHPLVHPNFQTRKAKYVYSTISNVVGDSTAPTGYARLSVESGSTEVLEIGERNNEVDAFWFGTRRFVGEPLIVPKENGDVDNEHEAFLLGMVYDAVRDKSFVAVFDLEKNLHEGPVCQLWLKSAVPHGLHGCFASNEEIRSSWFC